MQQLCTKGIIQGVESQLHLKRNEGQENLKKSHKRDNPKRKPNQTTF